MYYITLSGEYLSELIKARFTFDPEGACKYSNKQNRTVLKLPLWEV